MKATLSFNLPEESIEHLAALHGAEWKSIVWELTEQLRRYRHYGHRFQNAEECIDEVGTLLRSMIDHRGLLLE